VDFVDQEHQALQLLARPDVVDRLRETTRVAFVDEFQDTSPIQLALFLKLAQLVDRSFWVGDPKQAIYGFRGADPELMTEAVQHVVSASGGETDTLATSYRSRPGLVDFVNAAFVPAFGALGFEEEAVRINDCARSDGAGQSNPLEFWALAGGNWDEAIFALAEQVRVVLENANS
jgi:ATP-dependent exoDNAse (exonuclease V) beta subunit